ncbi:MAG: hypothetical protein PHS14_04885 [Elusimicrobia bacterium]|nr:hypothetical protein [Elusimicrobiota bacterium]
MTPGRFFIGVVVALIVFGGFILLLAVLQHWLEDESGPPDPPTGDVPHIPPDMRSR